MASIKDALEESFQENSSIPKFILFSIPLYACISYKSIPFYNILLCFTIILLFGFTAICTNNVKNSNMRVLPTFNILKILYIGVKGIITLAPMIIGIYFLGQYVGNLIGSLNLDIKLINTFTYIIYSLLGSIVITSYLLFANKFEIIDAYNFKAIYKYSPDILISLIFMVLMMAIVDAVIVAPVTYIIWLFFGIPHPIAIFFWSIVGILNLSMLGHYLAQISYEIIEVKESKNKDL